MCVKVGKFAVLYMRVSTDGQNIAMQAAAASKYIKDIEPYRLVQLIDDGVSAIKVKRRDRKNLRELEDLIRAGRVETLIVYDRSRLARDFYEWVDIARLLIDNNVEVIFTGTDVRPFDKQLVIEAIYAIFAQMEGQEIGRRTADARSQFPTNVLGYHRHVDNENGKKVWYTIDDKISSQIRSLFEETAMVQDAQGFWSILTKYKRILKRNELRVLTILQNPFYAASSKRGETYTTLQHSKAIVDLDLFLTVQNRITHFKEIKKYVQSKPGSPLPIDITCASCSSSMKYFQDPITGIGRYSCSKRHARVEITVEELMSTTRNVLIEQLQNLNVRRLREDCIQTIQTQLKASRLQVKHVTRQIENYCINVALSPRSTLVSEQLDKLDEYEIKLLKLHRTINELTSIRVNLQTFIEEVKNCIKSKFLNYESAITIMDEFVTSIKVSNKTIDFSLSMGGYFTTEVDEFEPESNLGEICRELA